MFRGPYALENMWSKNLPNDALLIMLDTGKAGIADCAAFEHMANTIKVMFSSKLCPSFISQSFFNQNTQCLGILVILIWPIPHFKWDKILLH